MKAFYFLLGILFYKVSSLALSPLRYPHESYEEAKNRSRAQYYSSRLSDLRLSSHTPESQKDLLNQIDLSKINEITREQLESIFYYIRDTRFVFDGQRDRRLSWLYPDDGCFARAAMASYNLKNFSPPSKVFIFGDLVVKTPNALRGAVGWWYHVAVAYRVGSEVYIIDPAIHPQAPLSINEWGLKMVRQLNFAEFAICDSLTYMPDSDCRGQNPQSEKRAYEDQLEFLDLEWARLESLNRNPEKELGNEPPWKTPPFFNLSTPRVLAY